MARLIKSIIGLNFDTATPEEAEAYRIANEALQQRMRQLMRAVPSASREQQPTTDRFGRALR